MERSLIGRLFLGGLTAVAVGLLLGTASVWAGSALGVYAGDAGGFGRLRVMPVGTLVIGLAGGSAWALAVGVAALLVAWAGSLANALARARRGWFVVLLALGLPTCGAGAVLADLVAGAGRRPSKA